MLTDDGGTAGSPLGAEKLSRQLFNGGNTKESKMDRWPAGGIDWSRRGAVALCPAACWTLLVCVITAGVAAAEQPDTPQAAPVAGDSKIPVRPAVPGKLQLNCRYRVETAQGTGTYEVVEEIRAWQVSKTAIIICDMWDDHYCKLAAQRVDEMAPRMNRVITAARSHGVAIVHAPSATMNFYAGTPYRLRMQQADKAEPPVPLKPWCYLDPEVESQLPVDTSKSPCDDPVVSERVRRYTRQHAAIKIIGYDGVSDSGQEIFNYFRQLGIKNVVLMGVHTNMCVLGRPFGIRQMRRLGMNVVLARDLTDAMYDPREWPYVSHTRGTELVIEHIEKYWCPSIVGADLTRVIRGSADPSPETVQDRPEQISAK